MITKGQKNNQPIAQKFVDFVELDLEKQANKNYMSNLKEV